MHADERDQFVDGLLEASLKQYRGEEPRPGLELRILAGIRTRERAARHRGLGWALAVGAGTLAAIVLMLHFVRAPIRHSTPSASLPQFITTPPVRMGSVAPRVWGSRLVVGPRQKPRAPKPGDRATRRPEQFPTPFPITGQEKLLLAYLGKETKPELVAGTHQASEDTSSDLEIPRIKIAALVIKPLDGPQAEGGK